MKYNQQQSPLTFESCQFHKIKKTCHTGCSLSGQVQARLYKTTFYMHNTHLENRHNKYVTYTQRNDSISVKYSIDAASQTLSRAD